MSDSCASPQTEKPSTYQSILELAEAACDVPVRWSVTGVCESCESGLVARRSFTDWNRSTPAEGDVLVCCSQPVSDRRRQFVTLIQSRF